MQFAILPAELKLRVLRLLLLLLILLFILIQKKMGSSYGIRFQFSLDDLLTFTIKVNRAMTNEI